MMRQSAISWGLFLMGVSGLFWGCEGHRDFALEQAPEAIVKGEATGPDVWKGVVAFVAGNQTFCTGTLIHPRVILTAGHCMRLASSGYNYAVNLQDLYAKGGANVGFNGGGGFNLPEISQVVHHPLWDGVQNPELAPGPKVDLALVLLSADTSLGTYCVQQGEDPVVDDGGVVVGYGLASYTLGALPGRRRMGDVTILEVWDREVKIGEPAGVCSGDSGGPLFVEQEEISVVGGVTSRGTSNCVISAGSVFTKVSAYAEWIDGQVFAWTGDHLGECSLTGSGEGTDVGSDTDLGSGTDVGSDTDTQTNTDEHGTDTDTRTDTDEHGTDTDTRTDTDIGSDTDTRTDSDEHGSDSSDGAGDETDETSEPEERSSLNSDGGCCVAVAGYHGVSPLLLIAGLF